MKQYVSFQRLDIICSIQCLTEFYLKHFLPDLLLIQLGGFRKGGKFSVCVILIDMLKAFVAVKLGSIVFGEYLGLRLEGEYFSALFCVIGHIFPAFYSFKGGKGILCSGTLLLLLDWRIAAVGWGLFLLLWLTTRYVSLGSVTGAFSFPVTTLLFFRGNWTVFALSLAIAALVIWAHRSNIGRLLHGTESRFQWHTNGPGRS